jgi:hypothetical protein
VHDAILVALTKRGARVVNAITNGSRYWRRVCVGVLAGGPLLAAGCVSPTAPPPPPAGGASTHLDYAAFAASVEPVLHRQGCDAGGDCHGGGPRGAFALSPAGAKDIRFDFDQASLQVNAVTPDSSRLLTKPLALAAGGTPHAFKPFATTADTDFVAIRAWILAGVTP